MFNLNQINDTTIETFEKYLIKNLWVEDIEFPNKKIKLFRKIIDDEEYSLSLPAKSNFKDSHRKINEAIEILAELKELSNQKLISEVWKESNNNVFILNKEIETNKSQKDILSFRIISKLSDEGIIPLEYGSNIVEGLKKLILSAIFNEEHPQPHFFRTNKNSHEKLSRYKLGQTAFGSYVFNVEIDNYMHEQLQINENEIIETLPEERKIIKRIQNGIYNIREKDMDTLFENGYKKGLNANMCDALLNFNLENYDVKIESKVTWSDLLPRPDDIKEKVILENKDFYKVKILSEKYKEVKSIEQGIRGRIIKLINRKDSQGNSVERNIVMQTEVEGKSKNVKIELSDVDYKRACEAHKQDQEITISGELLKEGKTWMLVNYKDLKII
ncbi:hypothetical protein CBE01nite_29740 [Clostridium beijerinckii]|uniref:Uncharacterized protein n=1 Tax=Clostridium beijerinckii TaxID=1520 RepID=A0AB74VDF4_CLOBE|nr:hypothetical protein [Clostridium beijerinckii]NRZ28754.1 hypothetical protein [Clostridium beijerinckii]NYB95470.1 hypothetical protein [Clostridium beijerinckii]OOM24585.1 hypothetical protein CLBEI_20460 [Clostridium beijerinckii]QUN34432.1 hypothetical protein KEC93_21285 [Clostridium beijerinckii]SQB00614.1 Uncharacterised protein [Clostridium beijerinckii]